MSETGRVIDLSQEGAGVVHAGKTAFVAGALPGELVSFRRAKKHKQHDEAELETVIEASAARVTPRCAAFGVCGGCALQHLDPAAQIEIKNQQLHAVLERVGKVAPTRWLEPLTGPVWNYRRRARLGSRFVIRKGRALVGFRERLSSYVTATERCEVLSAPVDSLIQPLAELMTSLSIRERLPQIEVAVADNAIALVLRVLDPPSDEDLQKLGAFEQRHGVNFMLQPGGLHTIRPLSDSMPALHYKLPAWQLQMEFLPTDFVQVNAAINQSLIARAIELLELDANSRVLDLYCGLGNFSLAMARLAKLVVGVEGEAGLVARARANAERNGLANTEFHVADLSVAPPPETAWLQAGYSHVLLDPPRVGAREMLQTVAELKPERLVYVSCHPGSLARDLGVLVNELGYELLAAGMVDMFPHTAHMESIALLKRHGTGNRA